jgi:hypothetical protein
MVSALEALWGAVLAVAVIPATIVAYLDFAERADHAAKEVAQHHATKAAPTTTGIRYRHNPIKTYRAEGTGPLV